ncbi:hypothetical protein GYMLUDRAFT_80619 [Collybiopsis luxurians FD-317 M1]|nr:hypothetical protein GYMLUDRAFT_80619 [Collybiopsis luxurians FD-317 M1]
MSFTDERAHPLPSYSPPAMATAPLRSHLRIQRKRKRLSLLWYQQSQVVYWQGKGREVRSGCSCNHTWNVDSPSQSERHFSQELHVRSTCGFSLESSGSSYGSSTSFPAPDLGSASVANGIPDPLSGVPDISLQKTSFLFLTVYKAHGQMIVGSSFSSLQNIIWISVSNILGPVPLRPSRPPPGIIKIPSPIKGVGVGMGTKVRMGMVTKMDMDMEVQ